MRRLNGEGESGLRKGILNKMSVYMCVHVTH